MSDLSNAEVYNRWKFAKKQTAKDYWYDFLLMRAKYGDKEAKAKLKEMDFLSCAT